MPPQIYDQGMKLAHVRQTKGLNSLPLVRDQSKLLQW
jgi:hypothetical protein